MGLLPFSLSPHQLIILLIFKMWLRSSSNRLMGLLPWMATGQIRSQTLRQGSEVQEGDLEEKSELEEEFLRARSKV